mmetsp:Transcript_32649/g.29524  ORF Transcript_32649/g.29524 Transcript_32649/m.29524 type:complete len:95 (-) Transcript_32649:535-819(-)|eukprot:CAMPEP_0114587648 /NCGR_PEP_ID=MMETSP0125-20121206/10561_1 /TAXON_ID=485358 ORGANISM="Aristerostoma sp., Strain ATCC 50986" /NCGR_SAMPLE_ID=MMETSP0125 /ASSEMBLY_ACC=CAM_ASM_000245 /LENGTH=94 /DNA_ID=CAMNT_0001783675 /DNA_START=463 /DNA_END=747 /DNA_ORIENTATION=-
MTSNIKLEDPSNPFKKVKVEENQNNFLNSHPGIVKQEATDQYTTCEEVIHHPQYQHQNPSYDEAENSLSNENSSKKKYNKKPKGLAPTRKSTRI